MSREALHDEEPDQIEGNYIVVGHPVPLWQPKKVKGKSGKFWISEMSFVDLSQFSGKSGGARKKVPMNIFEVNGNF